MGVNKPLMSSQISARRQGSRGRRQWPTTCGRMGLQRARIDLLVVW